MKYIVDGVPHHQERPRATIMKKGRSLSVRMYNPPKSNNYKLHIQKTLKRNYPAIVRPLKETPLKMILEIFVPIPSSTSKKNRERMLNGEILPAKQPDLSNYLKLIEDACNTILYYDDNRIVESHTVKRYSDQPRIEIEVIEL